MIGYSSIKRRKESAGKMAVVVGFGLALAGCSGRTTGVTNIDLQGGGRGGPPLSVTAQLNAVGSCDTSCAVFIRWRQIGTSAWTDGSSISVGKVKITPYSLSAQNLSPEAHYEYQLCGKESSWSNVVCVGPDGTPNTTQRFVAFPGGSDWPQFRYAMGEPAFNPNELTIGTVNVATLGPAWSAPVKSPGAPVIANGVVYVVAGSGTTSAAGTLTAYPAECAIRGRTCRYPLWTASVAGDIQGATPAVFEDQVVVGARQDNPGVQSTGRLYAFDATNGHLRWTGDTSGPIHAAPNVAGGEVLIASDDGFVYAFAGCPPSGASCQPLWKSHSPFLAGGGSTASSPASDGSVYIGSPDGHLYAFRGCCDGDSGTLDWVSPTGGPIHSSPAVVNSVVYVGSDDGKLYAFTSGRLGGAVGGQLLWAASTGGPIRSSPAVANGVVYVGSDDGKLYAFSASQCDACAGGGQLLWTGTGGGAITSSPAIANGVVYVGSADHHLYAFSASGCGSTSCSPLFRSLSTKPPSAPAVAGGLVYFTGQLTGVSRLHAYALP